MLVDWGPRRLDAALSDIRRAIDKSMKLSLLTISATTVLLIAGSLTYLRGGLGTPGELPVANIKTKLSSSAADSRNRANNKNEKTAEVAEKLNTVPPYSPPISVPVQVVFEAPANMTITWDTTGNGTFDSEPLMSPDRQNLSSGVIYRFQLSNIPGRRDTTLYPTIEVSSVTPRTESYLKYNAIPIGFTDSDLDQVAAGNFLTKVIYMPDPKFTEDDNSATATLVSYRLAPGVDPIVEADRRGSIFAIIRMHNTNPVIAADAPTVQSPAYGQPMSGD